MKRRISLLLVVSSVATAALAAAAIAGTIKPPPDIAKAGKLVFCTDPTYPPEEFYEGSKLVGSDIEIATDVSRRMGVKAEFLRVGFDGIIAAVLVDRCDAVISGMNSTPERAKQVSFVDYISVGQSLMVQKGNPTHITSLASASGHTIAVQTGTTMREALVAYNKTLKAKGKKEIQIITFPKDTDAANALKTGKVDAYFADAPVVAYYIKRDPIFAFGGAPINKALVGIAMRKDNVTLKAAVQKAINAMYADGTMTRILKKWNMAGAALRK